MGSLEDKVFIVFWVGSWGYGFVDSWRLKTKFKKWSIFPSIQFVSFIIQSVQLQVHAGCLSFHF